VSELVRSGTVRERPGGATSTAASAGARRERTPHVYPVDLVRVLTFAAVIMVHTICTVNPLDSRPGGAAVILLHFTREAFFFLTGFVLVHRYRDVGVRPAPFWRRRFLLVGVPYLAWSLLYSAIGLAAAPLPPGTATRTVLVSLATGTAWFHLYFLLVSLQFYLLFPAFQWLLRVTRGHHRLVLTVSLALQVITYQWLRGPATTPASATLLLYGGSCVLTYQFFPLLGGAVAMHRPEVEAWLRGHRGWVTAAVAVTGVTAEACYVWSLHRGTGAEWASDVFQPVVIAWSSSTVAGLYLLGLVFADRRRGGRASRLVEWAADRSFGVFLVHPVILWLLTAAGPTSPSARIGSPVNNAVVYLAAVIGSLLIVEALRRTPMSLAMTGKRRSGRPARPAAQPARSVEPPRTIVIPRPSAPRAAAPGALTEQAGQRR
jgi:peptidoglycan/LPS O-acetylase OafA/YrhL